jgi:hypothetical protein
VWGRDLFGDTRPERFDENVGFVGQLLDNVDSGFGFQIDGN